MCYPKPGPRCASTLRKRKSALGKQLREAQATGDEEQANQINASLKQLNNEFALTPQGLKKIRQKVNAGEVAESVYTAAKAERERRIRLSKGEVPISKAHATNHALDSSLTYEGSTPRWLHKGGAGPFGAKPEIIDVIDTNAGKMAVVWEYQSLAENDFHVQTERGFHVHRITYQDLKTGAVKGYLKIGSVSEESMAQSFGNDQWSTMRFYSDRCGRTFMTRYDDDGGKTDLSTLLHNPSTRLEAKTKIWLGAHMATRSSPKGSSKGYYQLTEDDAPSEEEMDRDLANLQEEYMDEEWDNYQKNHHTPTIDYSKLDDSLRGQGLGPAMYVYGARKLAEKGKVLRSSSIQSDDATGLWARMAKNDKLPISTRSHSWSHDDKPFDVMVMDFTEQDNKGS